MVVVIVAPQQLCVKGPLGKKSRKGPSAEERSRELRGRPRKGRLEFTVAHECGEDFDDPEEGPDGGGRIEEAD